MSGAVQYSDATAEQEHLLSTGTEGPAPQRTTNAELKQAVAERIAAHRHRRASEHADEAAREERARARAEAARNASRRGANMVREAVAARYQQTQSYREFLAVEAERALQQAQAEAEMAARKAHALAEAQEKLLAEMEQWREPEPVQIAEVQQEKAEARGELAHALADIAMGAQELMAEPPLLTVVEAPAPSGVRVKLFETIEPLNAGKSLRVHSAAEDNEFPEELEELEQEIEFRRAPEFTSHTVETLPIPANIIEFPRQLIAPRKARPRLAEGPLLEESAPEPQLRIFEVEPEQVLHHFEFEPVRTASGAPEWQGMLLEPSPATLEHRVMHSELPQYTQALEPAPVGQRLLAAAVDAICVLAAFVGFACVVTMVAGPHLLAIKPAVLAGSALGALAVFHLLYQTLFFTFGDATPGMLYARIGLCTFGDENPSRKAMRRRTFAMLLAACPLGLGLAWMWMDEEGLGWHDRMSRMYQRGY